ncbi:unnamed protein product [Lactuca saligna]|uniref:Uncharacterized protein n=1 Tax=Lactuca saligna TaxID=75948 RepID=A0AA36E2T3_LACSI|nr:unnamed protein product [Lactuca saligna]
MGSPIFTHLILEVVSMKKQVPSCPSHQRGFTKQTPAMSCSSKRIHIESISSHLHSHQTLTQHHPLLPYSFSTVVIFGRLASLDSSASEDEGEKGRDGATLSDLFFVNDTKKRRGDVVRINSRNLGFSCFGVLVLDMKEDEEDDEEEERDDDDDDDEIRVSNEVFV